MDPGYETVVDFSTIVWTLSAMVLHGVIVIVQASLILFLLLSGALALFFPTLDAPSLWRLGAMPADDGKMRAFGAARLALGLALALPLAGGAPYIVTIVASGAVLALMIRLERSQPRLAHRRGRVARRAAMAAAALVAAFAVWEAEDGLDLGVEVIASAQRWRVHELDWQLANDREAPKVGDRAPDFELQDPSGATAVRLSDFRGKRPVALVFGSYT